MDDLISRQAAIDAIDKRVQFLKDDPVFRRKHGDIDLYGIKPIIRALPSAQPEQRWIPLKEREPKEEGEYLVSFDDGFIATTGYYEGDFELWADAGEPIAWMPLPESYSGE